MLQTDVQNSAKSNRKNKEHKVKFGTRKQLPSELLIIYSQPPHPDIPNLFPTSRHSTTSRIYSLPHIPSYSSISFCFCFCFFLGGGVWLTFEHEESILILVRWVSILSRSYFWKLGRMGVGFTKSTRES